MRYDLVIIGAGPAGMEAALQARQFTRRVLVIDQRSEPGGNVYAHVASNQKNFPHLFQKLEPSYRDGLRLVERFLNSDIEYRPGTSVWHLDNAGEVACNGPQSAYTIQANKIIIATGAYERPMPLSGWTLPGVMGVGAAQLALKSSSYLPKGPCIIVGDGPLALLYSRQLRLAGGDLCATVIPQNTGKEGWVASGLKALRSDPQQTLKGLTLLAERQFSSARVYRNARQLEIIGSTQVEGVRFEINGRLVSLPAANVLLDSGIVPDINICAGSGLDIEWSARRQYWYPRLQTSGQSSRNNIYVAGDAGGILGAKAAHLSGRHAAIAACAGLGIIPQYQQLNLVRRLEPALERQRKFRSSVENMYPVFDSGLSANPDEVTICRCEGTKANEIAQMAAELKYSAYDPNRLKSLIRSGMGPCQGRLCNLSIARLAGLQQEGAADSGGLPRIRAPYTRITLGELSNLEIDKQ